MKKTTKENYSVLETKQINAKLRKPFVVVRIDNIQNKLFPQKTFKTIKEAVDFISLKKGIYRDIVKRK